MPIRDHAITRQGDDPSAVSDFTQPQDDIDPGQTCSDERNRRIGIQALICFRRPRIVAIQTRIGRRLRYSRQRSWIEVACCENDKVGP